MKSPRFSVSGLMAVVVVVALDCSALKAVTSRHLPDLSDLILFGALPMANVLAVGAIPFLIGRAGEGTRRAGLVGFEVFGLFAWLIFLASALTAPHTVHEAVGGLPRAIRLDPGPIFAAMAAALLLLPQLALAVLGGRLHRAFEVRVRVEARRRPQPEPAPGPELEPPALTWGAST